LSQRWPLWRVRWPLWLFICAAEKELDEYERLLFGEEYRRPR